MNGDDRATPPSPRLEERFFDDRDGMAASLARAVANDLRDALQQQDTASLAVPGGTTPRAFLRALGQEELDWPRVRVTLTDERWVPADHPDSNERLVREELFAGGAGGAGGASWIGLYTGDAEPRAALSACERRIVPLLPFDVVVLGMGEDGHVASLFPGQPDLAESLDPAGERTCGVARAPGTGAVRLSLLAPALLSARRSYLLIAGKRKLAVYRRALDDAQSLELPVAAVLHGSAAPVRVYWAP
ncbi:MAG TPA: 6-phosphogluconolactonase [Thermoanaerobaculia bacterium]|nr:6-phosphogluconolactonase [Thermoanaerobaculia bacterium]